MSYLCLNSVEQGKSSAGSVDRRSLVSADSTSHAGQRRAAIASCKLRGTDGLTAFLDSFALGLSFGRALWSSYGELAGLATA